MYQVYFLFILFILLFYLFIGTNWKSSLPKGKQWTMYRNLAFFAQNFGWILAIEISFENHLILCIRFILFYFIIILLFYLFIGTNWKIFIAKRKAIFNLFQFSFLAIYNHPKYFWKRLQVSLHCSPSLAGRQKRTRRRRRRKRSTRDLAKAKPQKKKKKKKKSRRRGSRDTGTRRSKKTIIRAARVPPFTQRRRIPQTQQKIAKIETSRACTRISQKENRREGEKKISGRLRAIADTRRKGESTEEGIA